MDDALPFSANLLFANVAGLLGLALVILYTQPVIAIAFLPLALVYRHALHPCSPGLLIRNPARLLPVAVGRLNALLLPGA